MRGGYARCGILSRNSLHSELSKHVILRLRWASSFSDLVCQCMGASPQAILSVLSGLALQPNFEGSLARNLIETTKSQIDNRRPWHDSRLPLPHPLEYDWRFSKATNSWILNVIKEIGGQQVEKILFVGTPTTALHAADSGFDARLLLAARSEDPVVCAVLEHAPTIVPYREWNVNDTLKVDVAVVDPPWYDSIALPMMAFAVRSVRPGGLIMWFGPDELTAPSSAEVFRDLSRHGSTLGLEKVELLDQRAHYETPFFEKRSMVAAGIFDVHPQWRTGKAWIARRSHYGVDTVEYTKAPSRWAEINVLGSRIRFDISAFDSERLRLPRFEILTLASRADPKRFGSTIWTSGNAVARMTGAADLWSQRESPLVSKALARVAREEAKAFNELMHSSEMHAKQAETDRKTRASVHPILYPSKPVRLAS